MAADRRVTSIGIGVFNKAQLNFYSNYAIASDPRYVQLSTADRCTDILQTQV